MPDFVYRYKSSFPKCPPTFLERFDLFRSWLLFRQLRNSLAKAVEFTHAPDVLPQGFPHELRPGPMLGFSCALNLLHHLGRKRYG
jgi:hypothetical protein